MQYTPFFLSILLIVVTGGFVYKLVGDRWTIFLHLILLFFAPWLLILMIAWPDLSFLGNISKAIAVKGPLWVFSWDFLFFSADTRARYGISDFGLFLPSFAPLIICAIYVALISGGKLFKVILGLLVLGIVASALIFDRASFNSSLLFVPTISILSTIGATKYIQVLRKQSTSLVSKILIVANFSWILYEALRLWEVILVQKPFAA